jgi:hypothetical protein
MFFFAVAQFVLAFAPLMEGRFGPDARAHAEEAGTNIHHAHNEADCAACTARDLMAAAEPGAKGFLVAHLDVLSPVALDNRADGQSQSRSTRPRAPPAPIA